MNDQHDSDVHRPDDRLPTLDDVVAAHRRLEGVARWTPIIHSDQLSKAAGCQFLLKPENLQRTGSFKLRGAYNKVALLSDEERRAGVVTFSAGNHAQGVAVAASLFGCPATVIMPEDVSPVKKEAVAGYGAQILLKGATTADREAEARRLAAEHGYAVIPAYADPDVIAGQGTVALEILHDVPDLDILVVPVGGGGLISGCALAVKASRPRVKVIGVEPEGANDAYQSLRSGRLVSVEKPTTMADGLRSQQVGQINWELIRRYVDDIVLVSEDEIADAMRMLLTRTKLLAEPSGAVAPAAVLSGKIAGVQGKKVASVISGGNVDLTTLTAVLAAPTSTAG